MFKHIKNNLSRLTDNKLYRESKRIILYCFAMLFVFSLLLLLVETIWEQSISSYLNMNILMIVVIIFAIIVTLTQPDIKEEGEHEKLGKKRAILTVCIGIGGGLIIWYKTNDLGWLSYLISIIGGGVTTLISLVIMGGNGLKTRKTLMDSKNTGKDKSGNHSKLESR
ncbi:MAG: hypothetical protein JSV32_06850 [Dehalococcoidia bacterium]|nr:MAG: hypothetical protein JSV32_06850 [Dehalococcoidia bacterium]